MGDIDRLIKRYGEIDKRMLHARGVLSDNNMFGPEDANPNPLGGSPLVEAKGFQAVGELFGQEYWVAVFWGGELGGSLEIRGWDASWVAERLATHEGESFGFTATGPYYKLRMDNALSILTALMDLNRSHEFEWRGDKPPGYPRFSRQTGVDY